MGVILGADGKIHQGEASLYYASVSRRLHPEPVKDGNPLAAMRAIFFAPEVALFMRMGRVCERCFPDA